MNDWQPIETAPIKPFDKENWFAAHSPDLLLWNGYGCTIGRYGFTQKGKGRWYGTHGNIHVTHWMPLPKGPDE